MHAKERFFERTLKYNINYEEIEKKIRKQELRERQKNGTIKTIFQINQKIFIVIKEETKKWIKVISIWEANEMK